MARSLSLVALLLAVVGCASVSPETPAAVPPAEAPRANAALDGTWLMTVHPAEPRGLGSVRTALTFEPGATAGTFEAHSRPDAVRDLVGEAQASMAALAGGEAYTRGALVHIYGGAAVPRGDSLVVSGRLVTSAYGALTLAGGLRGARLQGSLTSPRTGAVVALFDAEPYAGTLPLQDYAALVPEIRRVMQEHYYDPRELSAPTWTQFWADAEQRLGRAQDDLEAVSQFGAAAESLNLSHFWLQRTSVRTVPTTGDGTADGVSFARRSDSTAVLTCRGFGVAQALPVIDGAFESMRLDPPRALIVDLRACHGGDLSSMRVAAHLLSAPVSAGLFLSNRWWATHDALPARETWDQLPTLSDPDSDAFFRALAQDDGALVGRVVPVEPVYAGPVYVLTSRQTASAAEPLVYTLRTTGRATIVGAPTAGEMLSSTGFPFGDGWELVVPAADYFTAEGTRIEGHGVGPTLSVAPAQALERALAAMRAMP